MFRAKILVLGPCEVSFFDIKAFLFYGILTLHIFICSLVYVGTEEMALIIKFSLTTAVLLSLVLNISFSCHFAEW